MAQQLKFFAEQWVWFVVQGQVGPIWKFQISPSLSNGIGTIRFELNLEALQVPSSEYD